MEHFLQEIIREYNKYKREGQFELYEFVGETLGVAQDFGFAVDEVSVKIKDGEKVKTIIKDSSFEYETPEQRERLNHEFIDVNKCRNWLVHYSIREFNGNDSTDYRHRYEEIFLRYADLVNIPQPSHEMDWIALKIIMTRYLMEEFIDRLNENPHSIFAEIEN